jgi:hypothetical protein
MEVELLNEPNELVLGSQLRDLKSMYSDLSNGHIIFLESIFGRLRFPYQQRSSCDSYKKLNKYKLTRRNWHIHKVLFLWSEETTRHFVISCPFVSLV